MILCPINHALEVVCDLIAQSMLTCGYDAIRDRYQRSHRGDSGGDSLTRVGGVLPPITSLVRMIETYK
ncbi:hypothetical protein JTE90_019932 [Oedothorax gibbosus]|uniref:Uncharacterized protein n=1 Tax=Oedothorax gibbosus TaxID=931172 RepID=A0AAV6USR8_9ARAC|nr:hypothetical protein JTE90_019932 [Oedothorax gibbosus]